ncbi:hypothetical protein [Kouleothrix sp.]|uniref:hypothetical protein n=1 Tax=Kouleothrix sp. TaxID=2779161 RepID=UPI00391A8C80
MRYDRNKHHRRSMRLRGYDYGQPGYYFVTICAHGRQPLFGAFVEGALQLNDAGRMVERWWGDLGNKFAPVRTDAFVVMPDHIHGIIAITGEYIDDGGDDSNAGGYINPPRHDDADDPNAGGYINPPRHDDPNAGGYINPPPHDDPNAGGYINPPPHDDADAGGYINPPHTMIPMRADISIRRRRTR